MHASIVVRAYAVKLDCRLACPLSACERNATRSLNPEGCCHTALCVSDDDPDVERNMSKLHFLDVRMAFCAEVRSSIKDQRSIRGATPRAIG